MKTLSAIDRKLIGRLHAIYTHKGIGIEQKEYLLLELTEGRTAHTNELTYKEATYLWGYLNGRFDSIRPPRDITSDERMLKRRRSGALKRMQLYGIDTTDWDCVNSFCQKTRIAGKVFYDLNPDELLTLISKLESMLKKQEEK